MSRNFFEKHFFPDNLDLEELQKCLPVPSVPTDPIKLARFSITGPMVYVGGRYRKLSRDLSQTPWILNGTRMKECSVQEIINEEICPYFGLNSREQAEKVTFMGSGREDVDVSEFQHLHLIFCSDEQVT